VVPNLVGLPQAVAVSKARGLGLETDVQTLALSATPSGYVVSQTPLPDSRLPTGSTVALVVSSPA
jgi:beta-lactam-binding protein with PASTA domain